MIVTLFFLLISILIFKLNFIKNSIFLLIPFYFFRDEFLNIVKLINVKLKFISIPIEYPSYIFIIISYLLFAIVVNWILYFSSKIYVFYKKE